MNNSKEFMPQKWLIVFLVPLALLRLGCTDEANTRNETNTPNEANKTPDKKIKIISPENESVFANGNEILFQAETTDKKGLQGVEIYLDDQKIDISSGWYAASSSVG